MVNHISKTNTLQDYRIYYYIGYEVADNFHSSERRSIPGQIRRVVFF